MRPDPAALALAALIALIAGPALGWEEPARGTPLRAALLDAVRPLAVRDLGAPVEFVVHVLRVSGDRAFASVMAQRPGGVPIDMATTPMARRGNHDPDLSEGPTVQALLALSDGRWVSLHHATGATDAWWIDPLYCPGWGAVLSDVCP